MDENPDETLALLADLTGATDPKLRELARQLAGQLFLELARRGPSTPRGVGRLHTQPYAPDRGDIDIDASLDTIVEARAARSAVDPEGLRVRAWSTPDTAICLLVDRSGSMTGRPLATAGVATAAVAWRAPEDLVRTPLPQNRRTQYVPTSKLSTRCWLSVDSVPPILLVP